MAENKNEETINNEELNSQESAENTANVDNENAAEETTEETLEDKYNKLAEELEQQKNKYLYLMAEFDNFRKRTLREKEDLIRYSKGKAIGDMLPVVDDFERAIKANEKVDDINAIKEGFELIYNKFIKYLDQQQVKAIESTGCKFDTELHEAITSFPVENEEQKGVVIDTVLTGYTIDDKVLRHAKVVVGQ